MDADPSIEADLAPEALQAWGFVRQMLDDMTAMVVEDAETELELLEGLRVLECTSRPARPSTRLRPTPS